VDPEIKKALANMKRRQAEIDRKFGKQTDDGPIFGRRHERKNRQERDHIEELFDDEYDE
jgi:hypothetical protein